MVGYRGMCIAYIAYVHIVEDNVVGSGERAHQGTYPLYRQPHIGYSHTLIGAYIPF
jgi:hypothetical protein